MNDALSSITEVSNELGISSRTLRYYEEKGLISSTRDSDSQKRRYMDVEVIKIKHIHALRTLGFSINRIHTMLLINTNLAETLEKQKEEIKSEISEVEKQIRRLEQAETLLREEEHLSVDSELELRELQETIAFAAGECIMNRRMPDLNQYLASATKKLFDGNINLDYLVSQLENKFGVYQNIQSVEIINNIADVWLRMKKSKDTVSISFVFHGKYITSVRIGGVKVIGNVWEGVL